MSFFTHKKRGRQFFCPNNPLLIMKLTVLLILAFNLQMLAKGYSQSRITLNLKSADFKTVVSEIEKKTSYRILFSDNKIPTTKFTDIHAEDRDALDLISELLTGSDFTYQKLNNDLIAIVPKGLQITELVVSGYVVDEKDQPLAGVTVKIKGVATSGLATDKNGAFKINVPDNAILTFTFLGYETAEVPVSEGKPLKVKLTPNSQGLGEVVVVGYGTQKKVTVTGAVSSIKGDDLKTAPVPAISNSLVGRTPGIISSQGSGEPGYDDASILIRGRSTFQDASPLVVIDGVADRAGGFSRLDANDVESISVLKDASAAIYGSRSANGVILVTTKRGKTGKPTVSYTFNYGLRQPTRLPKMLDAATYAEAYNEIEQTIYNRAPKYTEDDIRKYRDGSDPIGHPNTNWYDVTLRKTSPQYQHNLSVQGGTDNIKYFVSGGYQFQDGYYINSATKYKQYNVRSNIDAQITSSFKLSLNLAARQENRRYPHHGSERIFNDIINGDPKAIAYWPDSKLPGLPLGDDRNPVVAVTDAAGYQRDDRTFLNGDLVATWNLPVKGLTLTGGFYVDKSNTFYKNWFKSFTLYDRDPVTGTSIPRIYGPADNANLSENMNVGLGITANIRLNYAHKFGDHNLSGFVAYEQYNYSSDYLAAARSSFISSQLDQLFAGNTDKLTSYSNDGSGTETARQNYFGRVDYDYKGKYLFQFNWRYDGSQAFPPGSRFGFFPGFSGGWRISEEPFFKEAAPFVDNLKIRASWGQRGNDRVAAFQYLASYAYGSPAVFGGNNPANIQGAYSVRTPNPNIKWEVDNTTNIGLESQLFNNKVNFQVDLFQSLRSNILTQRNASIPQYAGLTLPDENIGKVRNRGAEVTLGYSRTINDFWFNVSGNVTYTKSKILFMDEAASAQPWQMRTGKPVGADFVLYNAIGIFRSEAQVNSTPHLDGTKPGDLIFEDVNKDGIIDAKDKVRQTKSTIPSTIYGVTVAARYKNWGINMLLQGQGGNVAQYVYFASGEIGNFLQDYYNNRWTPANPNASGPRLYDRETIPSTRETNTYFLRSAAFLRLKTVELSYTLNKQSVKKLPFSNIRLYVSGFNLLTFDKLKYIDPEGQATSQNYAGWLTPQARIYNFGVNANF